MNKFLTILLIAVTIKTSDIEVCTEDAKEMVDQVFNIIQTFEENPLNPKAQVLKDFLGGLQKFLNECVGNDVDIVRYAPCVDQLIPVFPQIDKLIKDVKSGQTGNLVLDITTMALTLVNGITSCAKEGFSYFETRALF